MSEKKYLLVNPPKKITNKNTYNGIRAAITNSLNFRRMLVHNPTITFSTNLFLKVFKDFHRLGETIFRRSGGTEYPSFLINGKYESLILKFPKPLKSPLIKLSPTYLKPHTEARHERAATFDPLMKELFPPSGPPAKKFTGEMSISLRILKNLMIFSPHTKSSNEQILQYLSITSTASEEHTTEPQ